MSTVLVADDDDTFRDFLQTCLEAAGFTVLPACDGDEALRLARRSRPDLMLLDLMMPRTNGFEVAQAVRADSDLAATPIIVLTAKNFDLDRKTAGKLGVAAYLVKPVDALELVAAVRRACPDGGPEGSQPR